MSKRVTYQDLGLIDFKEAWDYQEELFGKIVEQKIRRRNDPGRERGNAENFLLFCEHPHVFTLGKNGSEKNLLSSKVELIKGQAKFYRINRGGDITYHGPGQIVGYPILDLENFGLQIREYIFGMEEAIIRNLKRYDIKGYRMKNATGVWVEKGITGQSEKICAIGVRASRYVTMHGFALNVSTDLNYFKLINPCGIKDKGITSMQRELGYIPDLNEVKNALRENFSEVLNMELKTDIESIGNPFFNTT